MSAPKGGASSQAAPWQQPPQVAWAAWALAQCELTTSSCVPVLAFHVKTPGFLDACSAHAQAPPTGTARHRVSRPPGLSWSLLTGMG